MDYYPLQNPCNYSAQISLIAVLWDLGNTIQDYNAYKSTLQEAQQGNTSPSLPPSLCPAALAANEDGGAGDSGSGTAQTTILFGHGVGKCGDSSW